MQESSTQANSQHIQEDRRRYPRIPIALKARIASGPLIGKACVVKDFCPEGLFIAWGKDSEITDLLAAGATILDKEASVEFSIKLKQGGTKEFSIDYKVIRVFEGGMGVSFLNSDKNVLNVLTKIAELTRKRRRAQKKTSRHQNSEEDQNSTIKSAGDCRQAIHKHLDDILREFYKKLANSLIVVSNQNDNSNDDLSAFEALEYFNQNEVDDRSSIRREILAQFDHDQPSNPRDLLSEASNTSELSLVDQDEFEGYLFLSELISRSEAQHKTLLTNVSGRLTELLNFEINESNNPIGFSRICRTIDDYYHKKGMAHEVLSLIYQEMSETLLPNLIPLYELLTEGVKIKEEKLEYKKNPRSKEPVSNKKEEKQDSTGTTEVNPLHGESLAPVGQHTPNQQTHYSRANSAYENIQSLQKAQKISSGVWQEPNVQQQDVLSVLDQLQHQAAKNWSEEPEAQLSDQLLELLINHTPEGTAPILTDDMQGAVKLTEGMVSSINTDRHLSESTKTMFNRLQSLFYKQAIEDNTSFHQENNPLRHIMNQVEKLDDVNNESPYHDAIESVVKKVLSLSSMSSVDVNQIITELDDLVASKVHDFQQHVVEVAANCDQQEAILAENRKNSVQDPSAETRATSHFNEQESAEWKIWKERAASLKPGEKMMEVSQGRTLTLAWVNQNKNDFVFVNGQGQSAARMPLQELTVGLIKGRLVILDTHEKPLFDRAVTSSMITAQIEVLEDAIHDSATGVFNAQTFALRLEQALGSAKKEHQQHAVFRIKVAELNFEKSNEEVNSCLNHLVSIVKNTLGENIEIGRIDDESVGWINQYTSIENARLQADDLLKALTDNPFLSHENETPHPMALGIVPVTENSGDANSILLQLIDACEQSLVAGENQPVLSEEQPTDEENLMNWDDWISGFLNEADDQLLYGQSTLALDETLKPMYQLFPAIESDAGQIVRPFNYIANLSDHKLKFRFDKKLIENILLWMSDDRKRLMKFSACLIPLSASSIQEPSLLEFILDKFTSSRVPPGKICFEISLLDDNNPVVIKFMRTLKEYGCRFSISNFGSQGIDQEQLKLPIDFINIDPILTNEIDQVGKDLMLIKSIIDVGHLLDKSVIISDVNTVSEQIMFKDRGVDYLQGNAIEAPVCLSESVEVV